MKLSELIAYRNQLIRFQLKDAIEKTDYDINLVKHLINNGNISSNQINNLVRQKHEELHQKFHEFNEAMTQAIQEVEEQIAEKEQFWFEETLKLYHEGMSNDSDEHVLNRRPVLKEERQNLILNRITSVSNSRQPAMIIRPGLETFIKQMVAFDPLYLIDKNENMLFPSTFEFPELYQRRLRRYIVDEYDTAPILERLPDNQFAVCFAYNFFNFKPIPVIEKYLTEIFVKLKPGGRLMMTFNDCDHEYAVSLAEHYYASYTPGRLVKEIAQRIGYEIYFIWNDNDPSTWIELEKPGTLTSLRGGQALAKIVHKT